jgi:hypothetical protein
MFFLPNQHQAMIILQGILFGTIFVVLAGSFPKFLKTRFPPKVWVFAERPVSSFCKICALS